MNKIQKNSMYGKMDKLDVNSEYCQIREKITLSDVLFNISMILTIITLIMIIVLVLFSLSKLVI